MGGDRSGSRKRQRSSPSRHRSSHHRHHSRRSRSRSPEKEHSRSRKRHRSPSRSSRGRERSLEDVQKQTAVPASDANLSKVESASVTKAANEPVESSSGKDITAAEKRRKKLIEWKKQMAEAKRAKEESEKAKADEERAKADKLKAEANKEKEKASVVLQNTLVDADGTKSDNETNGAVVEKAELIAEDPKANVNDAAGMVHKAKVSMDGLKVFADQSKRRPIFENAPEQSPKSGTGSDAISVTNVFSADSADANAARQQTMEIEEGSAAEDEDEGDPLDAFMLGITEEVKETKKLDQRRATKEAKKYGRSKGMALYENDDEPDDPREGRDIFEVTEKKELKKFKKREIASVDHDAVEYNGFQKNFYKEAEELRAMTKQAVAMFRHDELEDTKVRGSRIPKPIRTWAQAGLPTGILEFMRKMGWPKPTPIQAQSLPVIMSGRDMIGCAKTGSGKTLAFLLPLVRHALAQPPVRRGEGPLSVVMAPTRELAVQIYNEVKRISLAVGTTGERRGNQKIMRLRATCVYGGTDVAYQIGELKNGVEVCVCTPGRMIDILTANSGRVTNLKRVTYLVIDEADRMFDLGFEPQIKKIIDCIRPDRQTVMFSATFPRQMEALARRTMTAPVEVVVGGRSVVCDNVVQHVEVMEEKDKFTRLLQLLQEFADKGLVLIFVDRQDNADSLMADIIRGGYLAASIHGGKEQVDRDFIIQEFKNEALMILVATSVAARGLDVSGLNLVINYDVPNHLEDYVHRVGRTGRAGRSGSSYTFITPDQDKFAPDISRALKQSKVEVPSRLQLLVDGFLAKKKIGQAQGHGSGFGGRGFKFDEAEAQQAEQGKKLEAKALGFEEEEEEEEKGAAAAEDGGASAAKKAAPTASPGEAASAAAGAKAGAPGTAGAVSAARLAAQAVARSLESGGAGGGRAAAQAIAATLTGAAAGGGELAGDGGGYCEAELEINDLPQHARYKVTQKNNIEDVRELTGCAITTRGVYVMRGTKPPAGERKLYLIIEGPSKDAVDRAKQELREIIDTALENVASRTGGQPQSGRYQVV